MNRIKTGPVYTASNHKTGTSSTGDWESLTVRDERGKNPITIFVENNPSNIGSDLQFRIEKITGVSFGRRSNGDDSWIAVTSIRAFIEPVIGIREFRERMDAEENSSGEPTAMMAPAVRGIDVPGPQDEDEGC